MYEILEQICIDNNWEFTYGRADYQNLFDEDPVANKPYVFLDPVQTDEVFDEYNEVISTQYSGNFMLLMSSDIDEEDYSYKYQQYIKPLITGALFRIKQAFKCNSNITIESWGAVEIINMFDWNSDGIVVTYLITVTP